jgi:hypothetical protein
MVDSLLLTTALLAGLAAIPEDQQSMRQEIPAERNYEGSPSGTAGNGPIVRQSDVAMRDQDRLGEASVESVQLGSDPEKLLADQSVEIEELTGRNSELERQLRELRESARLAQSVIRDRNERVLRPLNGAPLVVRIRARNLRMDLDLDLYVQDPNDRLCNWKYPRVENRRAEVATLIPSEHLATFETEGETGLTNVLTEEAYYSAELLPSQSNRPYLVFCMLRETGDRPTGEQISQAVDWEVVVNRKDEPIVRLFGQATVRQSGRVMVQSTGDFYQGLVPLAGFYWESITAAVPKQIPADALPEVLRGWRKGKLREGATPFIKFPEVK